MKINKSTWRWFEMIEETIEMKQIQKVFCYRSVLLCVFRTLWMVFLRKTAFTLNNNNNKNRFVIILQRHLISFMRIRQSIKLRRWEQFNVNNLVSFCYVIFYSLNLVASSFFLHVMHIFVLNHKKWFFPSTIFKLSTRWSFGVCVHFCIHLIESY